MSDITIRPMSGEDVPIAAAWRIASPLWVRYGVSLESAVRTFEKALERDDTVLVADSPEARACGFVLCQPHGAFGHPYIQLIAVQPGYTSHGIGALLLDAAERIAAPTSTDMFLMSSDFNVAAQRFYRRHGYEQIGAVPGFILPDVTELIFRKVFVPPLP